MTPIWSVFIGQKLYFYSLDQNYNSSMHVMDMNTLKISAFIPRAIGNVQDRHVMYYYKERVLVYDTFIIIVTNGHMYSESLQLQVINTMTCQLKEIYIYGPIIKDDAQFCIIGHLLCIIDMGLEGVEISALNLENFNWVLKNYTSQSPIYCWDYEVIIRGSEIFLIGGYDEKEKYRNFGFNMKTFQWAEISFPINEYHRYV
ncbi:hypothetical protein CHUAL_006689 [Chamberlinius hualienensis]